MTRAAVVIVALVFAVGKVPGESVPVQLVHVDASVLSSDGTPVRGLSAADFEIRADGERVPVAAFTAGPLPINLVLLVDASGSMQWPQRNPRLRDALAREFLSALKESDRIRIGSIARENVLREPRASTARDLKRSLEALLDRPEDSDGPSPVWDAVYAAVAALSEVSGRRAVFVLTDGRATGNRYSVQDVAEFAVRTGVLVNVGGENRDAVIKQNQTEAVLVRARVAGEWLAGITGGISIDDATRPDQTGAALRAALDEVRQMYTLGFEAPVADGALHPLEVRVKRAGGSVRARQAYAAPGPVQLQPR